MDLRQGVKKLKGVVQNYSWGGYGLIPKLLGIDNMEERPYAEYWLGAHPNFSSILVDDNVPLDQFIKKYTSVTLGADVAHKFGSLPYLLKLLDVRQMLSIQVHPSQSSAITGYKKENKEKIDLKALNRNYKDENHKPELMVALNDFWLLHGFKKELPMVSILDKTPELIFLKDIFISRGYQALYEEVMTMDQHKVNEVLHVLSDRIVPLYENNELKKDDENFWAARAIKIFCKDALYDRGIFSIYLFNLVFLKKDEGIFQAAGLPHAYLEGQNVEVMANSDNVLRAGLTDKYVDVHELMKHVNFEATEPKILRPQEHEHKIFSSPAEEFELHEYYLEKNSEKIFQTDSAEIWIMMKGGLKIKAGTEVVQMSGGEAVFIPANEELYVTVLTETNFFRVTVPRI